MIFATKILKKPIYNILLLLILLLSVVAFFFISYNENSGTVVQNKPNTSTTINGENSTVYHESDVINIFNGVEKSSRTLDKSLIKTCVEIFGEAFYTDFVNACNEKGYSDDIWYSSFGVSLHVLADISEGLLEDPYYTVVGTEYKEEFTLSFAGDISLDDKWNWSPLYIYKDKRANLLSAAFSEGVSSIMLESDIFCVNLETPITDSDKKLDGVKFPMSTSSKNASILINQLGIDIVNIANDHIYEADSVGLSDTITHLKANGIQYIGAGKDLSDAKAPRYVIIGGKKIAYIAAAESDSKTHAPEALSNAAGIIETNGVDIRDMIIEARKNADYVVVYADWGYSAADEKQNKFKNVNYIEKASAKQSGLAHDFIDWGADIVLGCRSMVLQNVEYYEGKPIIYGLGNFWFETDAHNAVIARLVFCDGTPSVYLVPCTQRNLQTSSVLDTEEGIKILQNIAAASADTAVIEDSGLVIDLSTIPENDGENAETAEAPEDNVPAN